MAIHYDKNIIIESMGKNVICGVVLLLATLFQMMALVSGNVVMGIPIFGIIASCIVLGVISPTLNKKRAVLFIPPLMFEGYLITQAIISFQYGRHIFLLCIFRFAMFSSMLITIYLVLFIEEGRFKRWQKMGRFLLIYAPFPAIEAFAFIAYNNAFGNFLWMEQIINYIGAEAMLCLAFAMLLIPGEAKINKSVFSNYLKLAGIASIISCGFIVVLRFVYQIRVDFRLIPSLFVSFVVLFSLLTYGVEALLSGNHRKAVSDNYSRMLFYLPEDKTFSEKIYAQYKANEIKIQRISEEITRSEGISKSLLTEYLESLTDQQDTLMRAVISKEDTELFDKEILAE